MHGESFPVLRRLYNRPLLLLLPIIVFSLICAAAQYAPLNGTSAFSNGAGAGYQDAAEIATPANPASGNDRLFLSTSTHLLACLTAGGANCMPAGGAGTVTQVTSGNFSPLFTAAVAMNTTTPAFSFSAISQSANLFFASPSGSSGNPSFRAILSADLPASLSSQTSVNGTSIPASSTLPVKICSQVAIAMPTGAVSSATKSSSVTGTCTGLTTSDSVTCTSAVELFGVTGFTPSTSGILTINVWPTANTINAEYENNSSGSITPGSLTLNCGAVK